MDIAWAPSTVLGGPNRERGGVPAASVYSTTTRPRLASAAGLEFGRIVVSEIEAPNMLLNLVWSGEWMNGSTKREYDRALGGPRVANDAGQPVRAVEVPSHGL